jgi:hypothetical protein
MNAFSAIVRRILTTVFAAVLCTGCLPHVMHGPRIEDDGVSGSLSLTLGRNFEFGDPGTSIVPSLYGGVRRSYVSPDGTGAAFSIGLQVPFLIAPFLGEQGGFEGLGATSYADVYFQPARRVEPGWEYGGGGLFSTHVAAPYIQLGRMREGGSGWYTTHMIAFSNEFVGNVLYLPTVVIRHRDRVEDSSAANFSFGAGLNFERGVRDALFLLGVTLEVGLGR